MPRQQAAATLVPCPIDLFRRGAWPHADREVRAGRWVPVTYGVYAEAGAWRTLAPWDRYLVRVHATSLRWPDAVFVREAAASLRGLPVFGEPTHVHVAAPPVHTARTLSGVRVHTARILPEFDEIGGLLVATPLELAVDIARTQHHAIGLAVPSAAMRKDPGVNADALHQRNATRLSNRGRRHARWVFDRATARLESTLEAVSLAAIEWLGFELPELQRTFPGMSVEDDARTDFWWEGAATAGEADGDLKYRERDAVSVLAERRRRDALLSERGVRATAHWGWYEASNVDPLRLALLTVGLHQQRPEEVAELRALKRTLASITRPAAPPPREAAPVHRDIG